MNDYIVRRITTKEAKEYIHKHHYSHGSHHSPSPCYGLFDGDNLIGCLMFATPCSERVRASIFGKEYVSKVIELHRLHILDVTPRNTESWFISRCLKKLHEDRPDIWAVVSFSDSTEGHTGIIYKATNALYYGKSAKQTFYLDKENRLHHPRQCGVNISREKAKELNWIPTKRQAKYRYLWLLPDSKSYKRKLQGMMKINIFPYEQHIEVHSVYQA